MLVHIAPGDPIDQIVSPDSPQEVVEQVRHDYGLDRPLPVQYFLWLDHVLHGDLGRSIATNQPVTQDLFTAGCNTFLLAMTAAFIGFISGCVLGGFSGVYRGTWIDRLSVTTAVAGISIPHYWLGMVLVIIFSVEFNLLPAMGAGPGGDTSWAWDVAHLRYLILPAVTLSLIPAGIITRTVRGLVIELLAQEFITTLRGKGLRRGGILLHVLKNAAPPVLAVMGLQLGYLMGGSILVENVFSWPGTGMVLNNAIFERDIPVLQGTTLVLAMIFVILNLIVDLIQVAIDPRMRRS